MGLSQMKEVTFSIRPDDLRELASFLIQAADELESQVVSESWHLHCEDHLSRAIGCDVVVAAYKPQIRRMK